MPSTHFSLRRLPSLCSTGILEVEISSLSLKRPCNNGGFGWKKRLAIRRGWAGVGAKHDVLKVQGSQRQKWLDKQKQSETNYIKLMYASKNLS